MSARATQGELGRSISVDGVTTNYHDQGRGVPVLLIHGSGPGVSAWANWRTVMPVLARDFRVIAPDILGFGYTERPAGVSYTPDRWLRHLLGFIDALGLDQVNVVGNSFGGSLALSLASQAPERVGRLVLMGSVGVPFELTPGLDAVWGFEPSLFNMRRLLDIFTYDSSSLNDELAHLRLEAATRPGVQEAYEAMFPAPRQLGVDSLTLSDETLAGIRQEALIVHGRDDQVIPLSNSLRLLDLLVHSQLHVFSECGHWVQLEAAERFSRLVRDFLLEAPQVRSRPGDRAGADMRIKSVR